MTQKFVTIPPEVKAVLRRAKIAGKSLKITEQLARPLYVSVNKILELAGGKWNRKAAAHIFPSDPRKILRLAVTEGEILNEKQTFQLFPTPPDLAERMVRIAGIELTHRTLEPSAGTGNILSAILATPGRLIVAIEIQPKLAKLIAQHRIPIVICKDFLDCNGSLGSFDRIIMNPPFVNGADIKHIEHALTMLKPGGRLVAICANGSRQNEKLKPLADTWEELPAGTFKEQGTGVNTVLLTINK